MRGWKTAALLTTAVLILGFAPSYATSQVSVSPTTVPIDGTVTITLAKTSGVGPDVFASLTVTDPLGNVFSYSGVPVSVSNTKTVTIAFPSPSWTRTSGPGGNPKGTSVSGMYTVTGKYVDLASILTEKFKVTTASFTAVPEFGQSILILMGLMIPALLVVRQKTSARQPL